MVIIDVNSQDPVMAHFTQVQRDAISHIVNSAETFAESVRRNEIPVEKIDEMIEKSVHKTEHIARDLTPRQLAQVSSYVMIQDLVGLKAYIAKRKDADSMKDITSRITRVIRNLCEANNWWVVNSH